jgi:hypothetical protein
MGHHPSTHITPEVGKLSHRAVNQIPLVLYIPAPKDAESPGSLNPSSLPQDASTPKIAPLKPAHLHSYSPEAEGVSMSHTSSPGTRVRSPSRRPFTFRRIKRRPNEDEKGKGTASNTPDEEQGPRYEEKWEKGEYPFVKVEDNCAACAVCLCDFDEPRRIRYSLDSSPPQDHNEEEKSIGGDGTQVETEGGLKLTDAGEGAQPLRLLDCAHVFHVCHVRTMCT